MRANEFIVESREDYEGMTIEMNKYRHQLVINALDDWGNKLLGHVIFNIGDGKELDPQELEVVGRYRGQGIAKAMYDYVKSKGYTIIRSWDQTDAGKGFWDKHRGEDVRVWEENLAEIIQMPPVKKNIDINAMYRTALTQIKAGLSARLVGLDIGVPNIIVRSPDMYQVYIFDNNKNPIFYAAMSKFHDGFKTGAVASSIEGRGKGYGWKLYDAMSKYLRVPLYSDSTQTDDSRIGIWQQLIKNFPNRVVGYDQISKKNVGIENIYQTLPKDQLKDVDDDTRRQTLLLKLLP